MTLAEQRARRNAPMEMGESEQSSLEAEGLDPASRRVGMTLSGKWKLERLLGVGGMAAVYEGRHRNGARAAIKYFSLSVSASREICQRFLREGYLANKIEHPGVVRVLDDHIDVEQEHAYLVMELLDGESLQEHVDRHGVMAPRPACELTIELCKCLEAAHDKGVVHRDIKPDNLFLDKNGLKVLDFGIARAIDASQGVLTKTGSALGTPAYMAPEQALGKVREISPRSDIYSVGATLLYLVTGELMHEAESAQEMMVRAAWTPARKVKERFARVPDELADVIDRACAYKADERFGSAAELREALEAIADDLPIHPLNVLAQRGEISSATTLRAAGVSSPSGSTKAITPKESSTAAEPPPRSSTARWVAVGVGVAGLLFLGLWYRNQNAAVAEAAQPAASAPAAAPSAATKAPVSDEPEVVPQPVLTNQMPAAEGSSQPTPKHAKVAVASKPPPTLIKEPKELLHALPSSTETQAAQSKPPASSAAPTTTKKNERDLGY